MRTRKTRCAMQTQTPKFHAWRAAEKDAQQAERALHAAMLQFARSATPAPLADVVLVARAKRVKAHALFDDAMEELKEVARSLHHRQILTTGAALLKSADARPQRSSDDPSSRSMQNSR